MESRGGADRAADSVRLLWRGQLEEPPPAPSPRSGLTVDSVVDAAIDIAAEGGLESLTMRRVAERLGVSAMTPYSYVPGKEELLDLMLDTVYLRMAITSVHTGEWRTRVEAVAEDNLELHRAHPWTLEMGVGRPPLGPGLLAKYERELAVFDGIGLTDVEMDGALASLLALVRDAARAEVQAATRWGQADMDDEAWWEAVSPLLAEVIADDAFPLASRVGTAAGQAHGTAHSPSHVLAFGLERLADGILALVEARGG